MIDNKKVLAIIPARGGSKGISRKNVKELNGKPLIAYTIEEALKSKYIDRIVVSTEDNEIAEISKKLGGEIPCIRPKELSEDNSPTIDAVIHMINFLENNKSCNFEYICLLQCTSPLRTFEDIDRTIEKMIKTDMDGTISVCEAEVNPYWTNVFNGDNLEYFIEDGKKITRRQDLPKIYRMNGAVYVLKKEILLKHRTFEPEKITGYIMSSENSIDIDTLIDFYTCEYILKEREKNA